MKYIKDNYWFLILIFTLIIFSFVIQGCGKNYSGEEDDSSSHRAGSEIPLAVIEAVPSDEADSIALNTGMIIRFSAIIDPDSIGSSSLLLSCPDGAAVINNVIVSGDMATFGIASDLISSQTYTATLTAGVRDVDGGTLSVPYTWTFNTISSDVSGDNKDEQAVFTEPQNVIAKPGQKQSTITWDPVPEAAAYNIYWMQGDALYRPKSQVIKGVASPYVHANLDYIQQYNYMVVAVNSQGEEKESQAVSAYISFDVPRNVEAKLVKERIVITWDEVEYATHYNVYMTDIRGYPASKSDVIKNVSSPYVCNKYSVPEKQVLYFRVAAFDGNFEGFESDQVEIDFSKYQRDNSGHIIYDPDTGEALLKGDPAGSKVIEKPDKTIINNPSPYQKNN
ncbi:MAG: Ig-like domain-containing protein [bacterium]